MPEDKIIVILTEELKKQDVVEMFKNNKDLEKRVKEIVSKCVSEMFRVLWQHNSIFKTLAN